MPSTSLAVRRARVGDIPHICAPGARCVLTRTPTDTEAIAHPDATRRPEDVVASALELDMLTAVLCQRDADASGDAEETVVAARRDEHVNFDIERIINLLQEALTDNIVTTGNTLVLSAFGVTGGAPASLDALEALMELLRFAVVEVLDTDHILYVHDAGEAGGLLPAGGEHRALGEKARLPAVIPTEIAEAFVHVPLSHAAAPSVFLCPRASIIADLLVRPARVEDHDDLVPVFASQSEVVQEAFGTYFLAEVIEAQDAERRVLVGEGPDGRAVGLLAATSQVETDLLNACFELGPFGGLKKRSNAQLIVETRAALLAARSRADWFMLLQEHGDELQGLFDSILIRSTASGAVAAAAADAAHEGEGDDIVAVDDVITVFNAKGDAWGYSGVGGMRLGSAMLIDLGIINGHSAHHAKGGVISRQVLNMLVEEFAARRETTQRRARIAAWYAPPPPQRSRPASAMTPGIPLLATAAMSAAPAEPVPSQSSFLRGRRLVIEEFERLALEAERREAAAARAAASPAPAPAPDTAATDAAPSTGPTLPAKAEGDRHAAVGAFAGLFKQAKAARRSSTGPLGGDARRGSASTAAANPAIDKNTRVPLHALAGAVAHRLATEGYMHAVRAGDGTTTSAVSLQINPEDEVEEHRVRPEVTHASHAIDGHLAQGGERVASGPGHEFLVDIGPVIRPLIAAMPPLVVSAAASTATTTAPASRESSAATTPLQAGVAGDRHVPQLGLGTPATASPAAPVSLAASARAGAPLDAVDAAPSEDGGATNRAVLMQALEQWERLALPAVVAPRIFISASKDPMFDLHAPARDSAPSGLSAASQAAAEIVSEALRIPHVHVPDLLAAAMTTYAAASAAAQQAAAAAEEEERRKKEADDAAAAAKKGRGKDRAASAKRDRPQPAAGTKAGAAGTAASVGTHGTATPDGNVSLAQAAASAAARLAELVDPGANPTGAIAQQLLKYPTGCVITGAPTHDVELSRRLHDALHAAACPAALCLHLWEGEPTEDEHGSATETSRHAMLQRHASNPRMTLQPAERILYQAAATHASHVEEREHTHVSLPGAAWAVTAARSVSHGLPLPAAHGILGPSALVEATSSRLSAKGDTMRWLLTQSNANDDEIAAQCSRLALREFVLSALLREGVLQHDPDEGATHAARRASHVGARPANAFSITLFCLAKDYESRFVDLLAGAFEAYPDREYCILTQPHTAKDMPLLRRFAQAALLPSTTMHHTLYICHRDSLVAPTLLHVRRANDADRLTVFNMVEPLPDRAAFMDALVASEMCASIPLRAHTPSILHESDIGHAAPQIVTMVGEIDLQVVFVAVLSLTGCSALAMDAAAQSYELEHFLNVREYTRVDAGGSTAANTYASFATLSHVVCNPLFRHAVPYMLRQCMRLYCNRHGLLVRQRSSAYGPHIAAPLPAPLKYVISLVPPRRLWELTPAQRAARRAERDAAREQMNKKLSADATPGVIEAMYTAAGLIEAELCDPRSLDHALYVVTPRLSVVPWKCINARLVVVGASDAALACLASFLLQPHLAVPHITLVSSGGLPAPYDYFSQPSPFVAAREFTAFELARLPFSSFVRIIDDVVVRINRAERALTLAQGATVRYDTLALLPGLTESTWARLGYEHPSDIPRGMHCLSHANALAGLHADVETIVDAMADSTQDLGNVIVYGDSLDAVVSVNALLDRGIPGPRILYVQPRADLTNPPAGASTAAPSGEADTSTGSRRVSLGAAQPGHAAAAPIVSLAPGQGTPSSDASMLPGRTVFDTLVKLGVRTLSGYTLASVMGEREDDSPVESPDGYAHIPLLTVDFDVPRYATNGQRSVVDDSSEHKESSKYDVEGSVSSGASTADDTDEPTTYTACLLVCADSRDVDPRFFHAVNDCGIVYDGRLVVDHKFRATDPAVFAGGSVAKFSRRYRAPHFLQHYDSREVGATVAASVLQALLHSSSSDDGIGGDPGSLGTLLPQFSRPKATRALLPGGLHYLRARLPEFDVGASGRDMVTDLRSLTDGVARHCRLLLDRFDRVVEVEYIGSEPAELQNLTALVGRQVAYMNGLSRRFAAGTVPDLVDFFRGEWALALYHDRFDDLVETLRKSVLNDTYAAKLLDEIDRALETAASSDADARIAQIRGKGVGVLGGALPAALRRKLELQLLAYLRSNRKILPSYYVPVLAPAAV